MRRFFFGLMKAALLGIIGLVVFTVWRDLGLRREIWKQATQ